MMNIKLKLFFGALLIFCSNLFGYSMNNKTQIKEERLVLFTDRTLYVVGENIYLSAFCYIEDEQKQMELSKIFYVEILTQDGTKISGAKFPLKNFIGHGCMKIPDEVITGNYIIRAYTKYMRNFDPERYSYIALKIVNPQKNDVLSIENKENRNIPFSKNEAEQNNTFNIKLTTNKRIYKPLDSVTVSLKAVKYFVDSIRGLSITVVPEFSFFNSRLHPFAKEYFSEKIFYPETRGVSITGTIVDKNTGEGLPYRTINLSIIGEDRLFLPDISDSSGRFFFALPEKYGGDDIFICLNEEKKSETSILIDNDFSSKYSPFFIEPFNLSDEERKIALSFAKNIQISNHYRKHNNSMSDSTLKISKPFYGKPSEILIIDNYIKLPSLQEYFTELPTLVRIKSRNGKKYFKIYSEIASMSIYDPLILIDGAAIDDTERILAINPQKIDRIEVVDVPFIKGDLVYGGIISIESKNGDFAGVDLPESGMFISYNFLTKNYDCDMHKNFSRNYPDCRNTLFWVSNFLINDEEGNYFAFKASQATGKYIVHMVGIKDNGEIINQSVSFEIEN